jgi:hypothetical protein
LVADGNVFFITFSLTEYLPLLAITTDNLTVNEKTQTVATLISNQNGATNSMTIIK